MFQCPLFVHFKNFHIYLHIYTHKYAGNTTNQYFSNAHMEKMKE